MLVITAEDAVYHAAPRCHLHALVQQHGGIAAYIGGDAAYICLNTLTAAIGVMFDRAAGQVYLSTSAYNTQLTAAIYVTGNVSCT